MNKVLHGYRMCFWLALVYTPVLGQYNLDQPSRTISVEDGLPNHYMRGLLQDAYGFIWVGSFDGLSRFDGKQVEVFRNIPNDSTSLIQNSVISMAANELNGQVWIGSFNGLSVYLPNTGKFKTYKHNSQDSSSLPSD